MRTVIRTEASTTIAFKTAAIGLSIGLLNTVQPTRTGAVLAFVALSPVLVALWSSRPLGGLVWGFLFGLGAGLTLGLWVLRDTAPLFPELRTRVLAWVLGAVWIFGLPMAALGSLASATRLLPAIPRALAFSAMMLLLDTARSEVPGLIPFGMIGQSQAFLPGVAQIAILGGVPLVSALSALVSASLAVLMVEGRSRRIHLSFASSVASVVLFLAVGGLPVSEWSRTSRAESAVTRVLLVQPSIPPEARWAPQAQGTHLRHLLDLTRSGLLSRPQRPDLVVWPESSLTGSVEQGADLGERLGEAVRSLGAPVIFGGVRPSPSGDPDRYRAVVFRVDPTLQRATPLLEKTIGIPFAETAGPRGLRALLGLEGSPALEEADARAAVDPVGSYAVVLCYELLFPRLVAARISSETRLLAHLANDTWAGGAAAREQMVGAAVFRAIEQRTPVLRVSDGGSVAIDAYGRIQARLPDTGAAAIQVVVSAKPGRKARERFALGALALLAATIGWLVPVLFTNRRFAVIASRLASPALVFVLLMQASPSLGEEALSTLTLDGLSFISIEGHEMLALPSGSTIGFRFGKPEGDSVPFTVDPSDVKIAPVRMSADDIELTYLLATEASGALRRAPDGSLQMELSGTIHVNAAGPGGSNTADYAVRLTTERASAADRLLGRQVDIDGARIAPGSRYIQLVTATTNRSDAMLGAGAAVKSVLSGTFDQLPQVASSPVRSAP